MPIFAIEDSLATGSYVPILILMLLAVGFAGMMVALSRFVGRRSNDLGKFEPYECGVNPRRDARDRFSVKFYLVAILFILFDIEVVFLYPWAVRAKSLGLFGLVEMGIFLAILFLGYFYVLGAKALNWDASSEEEAGRD
jgi:NADH-quinone oxidoreductase subunit A